MGPGVQYPDPTFEPHRFLIIIWFNQVNVPLYKIRAIPFFNQQNQFGDLINFTIITGCSLYGIQLLYCVQYIKDTTHAPQSRLIPFSNSFLVNLSKVVGLPPRYIWVGTSDLYNTDTIVVYRYVTI